MLHHLPTSYNILRHLTTSHNMLQHLPTSYNISQPEVSKSSPVFPVLMVWRKFRSGAPLTTASNRWENWCFLGRFPSEKDVSSEIYLWFFRETFAYLYLFNYTFYTDMSTIYTTIYPKLMHPDHWFGMIWAYLSHRNEDSMGFQWICRDFSMLLFPTPWSLGPCRLLLQYTSRICLSSVDEADFFIEI